MAEQFKVVFTGDLKDGAVPDQVAEQFAKRFSCGMDRAVKLVQSGRDVVIKSGVDKDKADKYASALESLGMVARVEAAMVLQLEDDEQETEASPQVSATGTTASVSAASMTMETDSESAADNGTCPKCGSDRIKGDNCLGCGIIISKYLALQEEEQGSQGMAPAAASAAASQSSSSKPEVVYQMGDANPYQAPTADLTPDFEQGDMTGPVSVSAGNGWRWLAEGFLYFKRNPVAWILTFLAWMVISVVLSFIPLIGSLALALISPVITAGYMLGCREQEEGGDFQFGHLFSGFSNNLGQLILVGVLYLVGMIAITIGIAFFAGGAALLFGNMSGAGMGPEVMSALMLPILLGMAAIIPLVMAYWFAPALVALNDISAIAAMKLSFMGCLRNLLPFLLYGLILTLLFAIGTIPFGLGLLIVIPMMLASMYTAYRDIFYS